MVSGAGGPLAGLVLSGFGGRCEAFLGHLPVCSLLPDRWTDVWPPEVSFPSHGRLSGWACNIGNGDWASFIVGFSAAG